MFRDARLTSWAAPSSCSIAGGSITATPRTRGTRTPSASSLGPESAPSALLLGPALLVSLSGYSQKAGRQAGRQAGRPHLPVPWPIVGHHPSHPACWSLPGVGCSNQVLARADSPAGGPKPRVCPIVPHLAHVSSSRTALSPGLARIYNSTHHGNYLSALFLLKLLTCSRLFAIHDTYTSWTAGSSSGNGCCLLPAAGA